MNDGSVIDPKERSVDLFNYLIGCFAPKGIVVIFSFVSYNDMIGTAIIDLTAGTGTSFYSAFLWRHMWFGSNGSEDFWLENGIQFWITEILTKNWDDLDKLEAYVLLLVFAKIDFVHRLYSKGYEEDRTEEFYASAGAEIIPFSAFGETTKGYVKKKSKKNKEEVE
jgi:hypothetical protein